MFKITDDTGLWIGGVSFLVAMAGGAMTFTFAPNIGRALAVAGIICGLAGVAIHLVRNWRKIFRLDN
jgi:hypothetical protein